ncbi:MAG: VWA domain-containing protein [Chloroflexi bacterium]|nr:VWA domain-containing protein [Chloroflexota bacterium]
MPYTADISRANPGCFLFLIDQSGSMAEPLGGQNDLAKMNGAADALNRILDAISQRCSQGMDVRDYFDVGIITYTTDMEGNTELDSVLPGTRPDHPFLPISQAVDAAEVVERSVKESDGAGGIVEVSRKFPVWLQARALGGTPMCEALSEAMKALGDWTNQHPDSYPPMLINVSDGDATDGDPESFAKLIMGIGTNDGNVLIYNAHLSSMSALPVQYPTQESEAPEDESAARMFRMSSAFPDPVTQQAAAMGLPVSEGSRGYVYNADMVALVQFLDIGTRAATGLH